MNRVTYSAVTGGSKSFVGSVSRLLVLVGSRQLQP